MSEMAAIRGYQLPVDETPESTVGVSLMGSTATDDVFVERERSERSNPDERRIYVYNPHSLGAGVYYVRMSGKTRSAFSVSLGYPVVGLDITRSIRSSYYWTFSTSLLGGIRSIVQRPVHTRRSRVVTAGLEFRVAHHGLDNYQRRGSSAYGPSDTFFVTSVGARSNAFFADVLSGRSGMLSIYAGFAPFISRPVVGVSASIDAR